MSNFIEIIIQFFLFGIPQIVILIACYKYYQKSKSLSAKLLFFGSLVSLIFYAFKVFSIPILISSDSSNFYLFGIISLSSGIFIFLGTLSFAVGFFLLIKSILKIKQSEKDKDDINNIGK